MRTSRIISLFAVLIIVTIALTNNSCNEKNTPTVFTPQASSCPGIPTITDSRDGQVYPTVQIGDQCWLQKNMNYKHQHSWCLDNDPANCATYGRLYHWLAALGACPDGWHLPSDDEWKILEGTVDSLYGVGNSVWDKTDWRGFDAGKNLKSTKGWYINGTNSSGFTALPGGYQDRKGGFSLLGRDAGFWTMTQYDKTDVWCRLLSIDYPEKVLRSTDQMNVGYSVRCIKGEYE